MPALEADPEASRRPALLAALRTRPLRFGDSSQMLAAPVAADQRQALGRRGHQELPPLGPRISTSGKKAATANQN